MRRTKKIVLGGITVVILAAAGGAGYFYFAKAVNPRLVTRPANTQPFAGDFAQLLEVGKVTHRDTSLSPSGLSCSSCHLEEDSYAETFNVPYPHYVQSVRIKTGLNEITAEGMVQFCLVSVMQGPPLPWDSEALAALTAFVLDRNHRAVAKQSTKSSQIDFDGMCGAPPAGPGTGLRAEIPATIR
jgi:cytochrome c